MTRIGKQMTTATFAVLDKVFSDPTLPESWRSQQSLAYSNAYLRAAAQAFHSRDFEGAKNDLQQAVALQPDLLSNDGKPLADRFMGWTRLPKTQDPLAYLAVIYDNLPCDFEALRRRRRKELGNMAMQLAFEACDRGDLAAVRARTRQAFSYQPRWLQNRGALALLIRSRLPLLGAPGKGSAANSASHSSNLLAER
jgi:hypothetical protein